jgi:phytoene dehydrogenase-like protein
MTVHIVGAGLSGLAAAVSCTTAGRRVVLYEAAQQAGGRCRSYHDRALDRTIDNGNHLVLSGNANVLRYLRLIGAEDRLVGPAGGGFRFVDLVRDRDFTLRPNDGPLPWWLLSPGRRIPGTVFADYVAAARLAFAKPDDTVSGILPHDEVYRILWEPLAVSALNTPADEASARGFWRVLARTLARGGAFARPLVARETLADTFITPALAWIAAGGGALRLGARIRRLVFAGRRVAALEFDDGTQLLAPGDTLVLAVPPGIAARLVPGLEPPLVDEWVFRRPGIASVTVSAARAMVDEPAEVLGPRLWADVARAYPDLGKTLPPFRIVKEKRATIRQSPADEASRPDSATRFANLFLAGDWTRTGLPATIEGSILSGFRAAHLATRDRRYRRGSG